MTDIVDELGVISTYLLNLDSTSAEGLAIRRGMDVITRLRAEKDNIVKVMDAENSRLCDEIGGLQDENERLRAEVERLQAERKD